MSQRVKHIFNESTYFIFSFYFSRGLRMALALIAPILIGAIYDKINLGILVSSGALVAGLGDNPGTVKVKFNTQCIGAVFYFSVVLLSQLVHDYTILFGLWVAFCGFFFSMFFIYGSRAVSISTSSLLCLVYAYSFYEHDIQTNTIWFMVGVLFYAVISLVLWRIQPYKVIEQRISENIKLLSEYAVLIHEYFSIKFNKPETYTAIILNKIYDKQEKIHTNQEDLRENLFKLRINAKSFSSKGRKMTLIFSSLIDLYEYTLSLNLQDDNLFKALKKVNLKKDFFLYLSNIAEVLDELNLSITTNLYKKNYTELNTEIFESFKVKISALEQENATDPNIVILKHILFTFQSFYKQTKNIRSLINNDFSSNSNSKYEDLELEKFTQKNTYTFATFKANLNLKSSIFRHALRVAAATLIAYIICYILEINYFSWVFLTIIIILKPVYGNTKNYAIQRLKGTLMGGAVLTIILLTTQNIYIISTIVMLSVIGAYSFIPINYKVGVMFVTIFVILLIFLEYQGSDNWINVYRRIGGTSIAVVIAFLLSFTFLPTWEYKLMPMLMGKLLNCNLIYFQNISHHILKDQTVSETEMKLSRKDVLLSISNLSSTFQRIISEPKLSKNYKSDLYNVITFINLLSTRISSLRSYTEQNDIDCSNIIPEIQNTLNNCVLLTKNISEVNRPDEEYKFTSEPSNLTLYQLKEINILSHQIQNYILKLQDYQEWKKSEKYED